MIRSREYWLSKPKREPHRGKLARCALVGTALFIAVFCFGKIDSANANTTNHYRQWAFIQLNDLEQFYCLDELNYKESRWNPKAKNGSHYGIPQGRSKYLQKANGFKQVEWGLKYIENRYGTPCKALQHLKIKGYH